MLSFLISYGESFLLTNGHIELPVKQKTDKAEQFEP